MIIGQRFAYAGCVAGRWLVRQIHEQFADVSKTFFRGAPGIVDEYLDRDQLLPVLDCRAGLPDCGAIIGLPNEIRDAAPRLIEQRVRELQQRDT